jgi:hypothetical protein
MKKIYKISREEARRQAALAGITPLPEDSPYYSEGVSIQFVSRSRIESPGKSPIQIPRKETPGKA